jgi:hypothetical protein
MVSTGPTGPEFAWCAEVRHLAEMARRGLRAISRSGLVNRERGALGQCLDSGAACRFEHEIGPGIAGQRRRTVDKAAFIRFDAQIQCLAAAAIGLCCRHGGPPYLAGHHSEM